MKKKTAPKKKLSHSKKTTPRSFLKEFLVIFGLSLLILVISASSIPTTTVLGTHSKQSVLGEDEQKEEEQKQDEQKQEERKEERKEEEKKGEEQKKEEIKREAEKRQTQKVSNSIPSPIKTRTETLNTGVKTKTQSEEKKQETEIETADGQKIKTKVEDDGAAKVEIEDGGLKLKYVVENGKLTLKVENENGEENEATEEELNDLQDELEQELEDDGIEIASDAGGIKLAKNKVVALTKFPLSVNATTNQLVVTTPQGQKVVAILPDKAVENLLNTGIVNKIEGTPSTDSAQLANINSDIKLEVKNDEVVYRIKGVKTKKLLGLLPVTTPVTAFVSVENGVPIAIEQSLLSRIINTVSF